MEMKKIKSKLILVHRIYDSIIRNRGNISIPFQKNCRYVTCSMEIVISDKNVCKMLKL